MATTTVTAKDVRPLQGAIVRQKTANAAMAPGDAVTLRTDGKVEKTANASAKIYGVAVAGDQKQSSVAAGEEVGVVVFGPVTGFSGMVPGMLQWLSSTAGKLEGATGSVAVGYAEDATTLFVLPGVTNVGSS